MPQLSNYPPGVTGREPEINGERATKVYLGIDPGASGGLAYIVSGYLSQDPATDGYSANVAAIPMPVTERDVWDWFRQGMVEGEPAPNVVAVIEKVGGYIGVPHPGSAMFKFGKSYGQLTMALCAAGIPYEEITPQRWQKALHIATRGKNEAKRAFKNRLKGFAQKLFPQEEVTLATADALLIALYCQRSREGTLS